MYPDGCNETENEIKSQKEFGAGPGQSKFMQPRTIRKLHTWHAWTGLISGVNVLILSLTGSVLVFVHELHEALGPEIPVTIDADPGLYADLPLQPLVSAMRAEYPDALPGTVGIPDPVAAVEEPDEFLYFFEVFPRAGGEEIEFFFDPLDGRYAQASDEIDIPAWIWHLHADLFAGLPGRIFLGFVGLALLFSTVSGLLLYAPFMKGLAFGTIRRGVATRLAVADVHKLVGIVALFFNMLMATTGILLTLGQLLINLYSYQVIRTLEPVDVSPGTARVDVDRVLASARSNFPEKHVRWITFPGGIQGEHHYVAFAYERTFFLSRIPYVCLINAYDAEVDLTVDLPWWITMIYVAVPLHFGDFGGLGLRLVYCVFGLATGALSITGFAMFYLKRRRKNAPAQDYSERKLEKV